MDLSEIRDKLILEFEQRRRRRIMMLYMGVVTSVCTAAVFGGALAVFG